MKDFIVRNKPIFFIGFITLLIFVVLILMGQKNPPASPYLINVQREELVKDYSPSMGKDDAGFVLVEFSDFQCPACKGYQPIVTQLLQENPDDLKLIYRHFPIVSIHPNAKSAAVASMAAHKQGKFFEYAEKLFEDQKSLGSERYLQIAQELGLNIEQFNTDLESEEVNDQVSRDLEDAVKLGLNATPTFFLNGKVLQIKNPADLNSKIRQELSSLTNENREAQEKARRLEEEKPKVLTSVQYTKRIDDYSKSNQEVVDVSYTNEGFLPKTVNVNIGTTVKWTNKTNGPLSISQLEDYYDSFENPITVEPGQTYELKITHEKMWTYTKSDDPDVYGSVYSIVPKELTDPEYKPN